MIQAIRFDKGKVHDFDLYKKCNFDLSNQLKINADSGFQGIQKLHSKVNLPQKAPKLNPLTNTQKSKILKKPPKEYLLNISTEIVKSLKFVVVDTEENTKIIKILG